MKKILFITLFVLISAISAFAQDFEYGNESELKGLTRIFIDTGADMKAREMILKEINKAKITTLEITDTTKDAQIILYYRGVKEKVLLGSTQSANTTILNEAMLSSGQGFVFIEPKGNDKSKPRIVLSVENSQDTKLEKNPATKFGKAFAKAYKKANDLK